MRTRFSLPLSQRLAGVFAVALSLLLLVGCDSTGGLDEDDTSTTITAEETAESIASSLAESTGGTASELGDAASIFGGAGTTAAKDISRSRTCTYNDSNQIWNCSVAVSGDRGRIDTVHFDRTYDVQFFSGETVVRRPADADSMTFEIVEGSGQFKTSRIDNSHELVPTTWAFARTQDGTYTIDLLSSEAGRDVSEQFTGAQREHTREAEVRKTRVEGLLFRRGDGLVAGTIEGSYDAEVEIVRADDSTVSRSVSVSYVATFSEDSAEVEFTGGGERFDGKSFEFDLTTGELQ